MKNAHISGSAPARRTEFASRDDIPSAEPRKSLPRAEGYGVHDSVDEVCDASERADAIVFATNWFALNAPYFDPTSARITAESQSIGGSSTMLLRLEDAQKNRLELNTWFEFSGNARVLARCCEHASWHSAKTTNIVNSPEAFFALGVTLKIALEHGCPNDFVRYGSERVVEALARGPQEQFVLESGRSTAAMKGKPSADRLRELLSFIDFSQLEPVSRDETNQITGVLSALTVKDRSGNYIAYDPYPNSVHFVTPEGRGFTCEYTAELAEALATLLAPAIQEMYPTQTFHELASENPAGALYTCMADPSIQEPTARQWTTNPSIAVEKCQDILSSERAEHLLRELTAKKLSATPTDDAPYIMDSLRRVMNPIANYARIFRAHEAFGSDFGQSADFTLAAARALPTSIYNAHLKQYKEGVFPSADEFRKIEVALDQITSTTPIVAEATEI
jgi:hypothetical protein